MRTGQMLAVVVTLSLGTLTALAAEMVGQPRSKTQFATQVDATVGGKPVSLVLTGLAMRTRLVVNIYAIASYVQAGVEVKKEDLATADVPKRLHLVMEHDVAGTDMANAFRGSIRRSNPAPVFNAEVAELSEKLKGYNLKKGDVVYLTHIPGVGLSAEIVGKSEFTIKNPRFSRAVWDIYLGKKNIDEDIKTGLTSRL